MKGLHNCTTVQYVRVLLCVSSVPASCVHIWFVSCPRLMSLWVKSVPAVCMWLCVNYPVYLVPVFWVWFGLVYLWLPGVSCLSALSCPALMLLNTIIWVYVLVCVSLFLPRVCRLCAPWHNIGNGACLMFTLGTPHQLKYSDCLHLVFKPINNNVLVLINLYCNVLILIY